MSNEPTERQAVKDRALIYSLFDSWRASAEAGNNPAEYAERKRYAELEKVEIDSKQAVMFSSFIGGMQAALALVERLNSSDTEEDQTAATAET